MSNTRDLQQETHSPQQTNWYRYLPLIAILLTVIVFLPVLYNDFLLVDDPANVIRNPLYHPFTVQSFLKFWQEPYNKLYTPVTNTIWGLVSRISEVSPPRPNEYFGDTSLNPANFHALNYVFHIANTLLFYFLIRRILDRFSTDESKKQHAPLAAFFGALFFGWHPVQVEAVAWVTGFNNLSCALFAFLAVYFHIGSGQSRRYWAEQTGATVAFCLAVLCKPIVIALPLAFFLWDFLFPRSGTRMRYSPLLLFQAAFAGCVFLFSRNAIDPNEAEYYASLSAWWQRPFIAGDALAFYLYRIVWLGRFSFIYGRTPIFVMSHWWGYATWILPVVLAVLLITAARKQIIQEKSTGNESAANAARITLFGTAFALVALTPMLGLVPFYFQPFSTVADRYLYLPLSGIGIVVAIGMIRFLSSRHTLRTAGLTVITVYFALMGIQSRRNIAHFTDFPSLLTSISQVNPNCAFVQDGLGNIEEQRGHVDAAIDYYRKSLSFDKDYIHSRLHLAQLLAKQGKLDASEEQFRKLAETVPKDAVAHFMLAKILYMQGGIHDEEAIQEYQRGLVIMPGSTAAQQELLEVTKRLQARSQPATKPK